MQWKSHDYHTLAKLDYDSYLLIVQVVYTLGSKCQSLVSE